ncbi:hypothetical protein ASG17_05880 [Brevundimonas sp. Leaf363]|uniref:biliverdin-producing heme oxygenase n=1 Tax=Brevundimonas sp. Leaf363 TaxID=1736353 RepID=UPI0006F478C0|nr:biliverdin-producing heme oxygenase [Brevundimonas sp. Leaf363]KQS55600.1 hypothetical protein ASG17_05880 [Brevundimonas sp. Leaf363]
MVDSARFFLREATADAHARLDVLFSGFDLADRADYARFLKAQAGAFFGVEAALDKAGADVVLPDWPARRRSQALRDDLIALKEAVPEAMPEPLLPNPAAILGAAYVIEGSRLGGAMLVRTVADTAPISFLAPGNPLHWRSFVAILEKRLSSADERTEAARSASAVFDIFTASALRVLGADRL